MAKTINITDIEIHEIQFAKHGEEYSMNVLFSQKDADGREYIREWTSFKGEQLPKGITPSLEGVFTRAKTKILQAEKITN